MNRDSGTMMAAAAALLAGCATGNGEVPLMFGSTNVIGVSIGGNAADTGGEFVFGYKGLDLAIIPVSAVESGAERFVGAAAGRGHVDSYSVMGQFSAKASRNADSSNAGLGKFFATGMAAQIIANGFARKMGAYGRTSVAECKGATAVSADEVRLAPGKLEQKIDQHAAGAPAAADAAEAKADEIRPGASGREPGERSGARLIFAQYDYKALAIDGSALETGVKLTLGVRDRNLALIPMIGRDADGRLVRFESKDSRGGDVLSVLGQFSSQDSAAEPASGDGGTTRTADGSGAAALKSRGISSGLEKFFSTGASARILAEGFKTKLCEEYANSSPQLVPAQRGIGGGPQQKTEGAVTQPTRLTDQ